MKRLVSAYIPCCNNASTVAATVRSLLAQTVKIDEVFVIDDGSSDDSAAQVRSLGVEVLIASENRGRGATRARAMLAAKHSLVLCCDATNVLPADFLERALPWFADERVAAVFGPFTQPPARNAVERWRGRHLFKMDAAHQVNREALLATSGAMVNKAAVLAAGNYNPQLRHSEDRELGERLLAAGCEVVFDPALQVVSIARNNLCQVLERYWRWHAGPREGVSWKAYARQIAYAVKVMAAADLRARDLPALLITLFAPHYQFWRSWWRARL
jgi:glycosyltransferase involved in cell wall biosynthesis